MLLQCGHGMCANCAAQMSAAKCSTVQCPTCRGLSSLPLTKNFQLEEQIILLGSDELLEPSALSALRMAGKTISFGIFGMSALYFMPWFLMPVGVLFCACAMFWLRIMGESCMSNTFLPSPTANKCIGTLLLMPLMRPLSCLLPASQHSSWAWRLVQTLLGGISVSHVAVWAFGLLFFPLMLIHLGVKPYPSPVPHQANIVLSCTSVSNFPSPEYPTP